MDVDDTSVFLSYIKPNIEDIDKVHNFLDQDSIEYDELVKLIDYVDDNSLRIIKYDNQDFIKNYLADNNIDDSSYEAIKYLVSNEKAFGLPQYEKAIQSLDSLLDYLIDKKTKVSERIDILAYSYMDKYLSKKYYDIFASNNIFIQDPEEFTNFINRLEIDDGIKIRILERSIRENLNHYYSKKEVINEIKPYKDYLSNKYISMVDNVSKYLDLSLDINKLIEVSNYDKDNILLLKRIWLVNEINNNKDTKKRKKLIDELNTLFKEG